MTSCYFVTIGNEIPRILFSRLTSFPEIKNSSAQLVRLDKLVKLDKLLEFFTRVPFHDATDSHFDSW